MKTHSSERSPFSRLLAWLTGEKTLLLITVVYSIGIGLLSLVVPVAVQSLVNSVAFGNLLQPLAVLTLIVLAGLGFSAVLQGMRTYVVELLQRRVLVSVASDSMNRLLRAKVEAFDGYHGPELVNRFLEVVTVQKSGAMLLIDGLSILMQTTIGMILLGVYHPWLLAFDFLLLLFILVVLFPMGRGAVKTSILESKAKYELVAWLEEIARWPALFKSKNGLQYATHRTDELVQDYLTYRGKHFRILLRQILGSLTMQAVASALLLGVGGWLVIQRQLTLGQLVAAELVVTLVVSGFSKFGKQLETFYDLSAAVDKLGYLSDLPAEENGKEELPRSMNGIGITFRDVHFTYGEGKRAVLENANWKLEAGGRYALTGTGKSTVLNLIFGLRTPNKGGIDIDSIEIRDLNLDSMRAQIALVRQPEIFQGTLAQNLRLVSPEASSHDMRDALNRVGLLEDLRESTDGLETKLSTGGLPFSQGQATRLMIARAILSKPRLLILDECLDLIEDPELRQRILTDLFARTNPWTVLVVTNNTDVRALCDETYLVKEGTLQMVRN